MKGRAEARGEGLFQELPERGVEGGGEAEVGDEDVPQLGTGQR